MKFSRELSTVVEHDHSRTRVATQPFTIEDERDILRGLRRILMKLNPTETTINNRHSPKLMCLSSAALESPRSKQINVYTFPRLIVGPAGRQGTIYLVGTLLLGTDSTGRDMLLYEALETFAGEVHIDSFKGAVDSRMVEIVVVPGDHGTNERLRKNNFVLEEDELDVVDEFDVVDLPRTLGSYCSIQIIIIGLMIGNDIEIDGELIILINVVHIMHSLLSDVDDGVAAEHVCYHIIFTWSVLESVLELLQQKTPTTNTLGAEVLKTEILVVRMEVDKKAIENATMMDGSLDNRKQFLFHCCVIALCRIELAVVEGNWEAVLDNNAAKLVVTRIRIHIKRLRKVRVMKQYLTSHEGLDLAESLVLLRAPTFKKL